MNDAFYLPESFMASTDEQEDFKRLFAEIETELYKSMDFLATNPDAVEFARGPVMTGYAYSPLHPNANDVDALSIPLYQENVYQWSVPGTNFLVIDLAHSLASKEESQKFPRLITLQEIQTKAELEQLRDGLRAMRS